MRVAISTAATAAVVLSATLAATQALAGVTIETNDFIASAQAFNGFEGIPSLYPFQQYYSPAEWSEGGIDVTFHGIDYFGNEASQIYIASFPFIGADGNRLWYDDTYRGYTDIKLSSGQSFSEIQFLAGSGATPTSRGPQNLEYELLYHGQEVAEGSAGYLPYFDTYFTTYGFSGGTFDEVLLEGSWEPSFDLNMVHEDALAIDDIAISGIGGSAVPEPGTWTMLITGAAMIGFRARRRKVGIALTG